MNIRTSLKVLLVSTMGLPALTGCVTKVSIGGNPEVKYSKVAASAAGTDAWRDARNSHYYTTIPTTGSAIIVRGEDGNLHTLMGNEELLCVLYVNNKGTDIEKAGKPIELFYKKDEDRTKDYSNQFGDNNSNHYHLPQEGKAYSFGRLDLSVDGMQDQTVDVVAFSNMKTGHLYAFKDGEPLLIKPLDTQDKNFIRDANGKTPIAIGGENYAVDVKQGKTEQIASFIYDEVPYILSADGRGAVLNENMISTFTIGPREVNTAQLKTLEQAQVPENLPAISETQKLVAGSPLVPLQETPQTKTTTPAVIATQVDYDEYGIAVVPLDQLQTYAGAKAWNQLDHWLPKNMDELKPSGGVVKVIMMNGGQAFISNGDQALATPLQQGNMLFFSTVDDGIDHRQAAGHHHPTDQRGKRLELIDGRNLNLLGLDRPYGVAYQYDSLRLSGEKGRDADESVAIKREQPAVTGSKKVVVSGEGLLLEAGAMMVAVDDKGQAQIITMKHGTFVDREGNLRPLTSEQQDIMAQSGQRGERVRPQPNTR